MTVMQAARSRSKKVKLHLALSALVVLGACASGDGAAPHLQVSALEQVSTQGFATRPASVADIIAQLEAERPDPAKLAENLRLAAAPEPQDASPRAMVDFLLRRSIARSLTGQAQGELQDATRAVEIARSLPSSDVLLLVQALRQKALAEVISGSIGNAIRDCTAVMNTLEPLMHSRRDIWGSYFNCGRRIVDVSQSNINRSQNIINRLESLILRADRNNYRNFLTQQTHYLIARAFHIDYFGSISEAEVALRLAEESARELGSRWGDEDPTLLTFGVGLRLAQNLLRQDRISEAEIEVRRDLLLRLRAGGRYSSFAASGTVALARVLLRQGRNTEAERLSALALETYEQMGFDASSRAVLLSRSMMADALAGQGRWSDVLAQFQTIETALRDDPERFQQGFAGHPTRVAALLATGNAAGAATAARAALARRGGDQGAETLELRALLGAALFAAGDSNAARQEFAAAVPRIIETDQILSSLDGAGNVSARRIRLALESYLDLLLQAHARGDQAAAEDAFRVADAARSGQVRRALAAAAARAAAAGTGGPELAALARRKQDASEQAGRLEALAAAELAEPAATRNTARLASLRSEAASLRQAHAQITAEITRRFPSYAEMAEPRPATVAQARARLRSGEAMAAFYVGQQRTYVFGIAHGSDRISFAAAPLGDAQISAAVERLRAPLEAEVATASELPAFDVVAAHRLYRDLLLPLGPEVLAARELVTVPHRALGMLPFHLLVTEPPPSMAAQPGLRFASYRRVAWLARRTAVSQIPSVSALALLRSIPAGRADRAAFIGFGDPWFNERQARRAMAEGEEIVTAWRRAAPTGSAANAQTAGQQTGSGPTLADLERLPDTAIELREVAAAMGADPRRDVRLGAQATEAAVRSADLSNRRVVMFATHGLVPGDLDGLSQPALALTPPSVAGEGVGDGLLTADEILGLRLDADWVVLSACNTASADADAAEAVSGLGRAFLYAGARALLVTNWAVDSAAARLLTSELFRSQAADPSLSRAEALRRAMMTLMNADAGAADGNRAGFAYAHPLFWAPFSLIGDGGR